MGSSSTDQASEGGRGKDRSASAGRSFVAYAVVAVLVLLLGGRAVLFLIDYVQTEGAIWPAQPVTGKVTVKPEKNHRWRVTLVLSNSAPGMVGYGVAVVSGWGVARGDVQPLGVARPFSLRLSPARPSRRLKPFSTASMSFTLPARTNIEEIVDLSIDGQWGEPSGWEHRLSVWLVVHVPRLYPLVALPHLNLKSGVVLLHYPTQPLLGVLGKGEPFLGNGILLHKLGMLQYRHPERMGFQEFKNRVTRYAKQREVKILGLRPFPNSKQPTAYQVFVGSSEAGRLRGFIESIGGKRRQL